MIRDDGIRIIQRVNEKAIAKGEHATLMTIDYVVEAIQKTREECKKKYKRFLKNSGLKPLPDSNIVMIPNYEKGKDDENNRIREDVLKLERWRSCIICDEPVQSSMDKNENGAWLRRDDVLKVLSPKGQLSPSRVTSPKGDILDKEKK